MEADDDASRNRWLLYSVSRRVASAIHRLRSVGPPATSAPKSSAFSIAVVDVVVAIDGSGGGGGGGGGRRRCGRTMTALPLGEFVRR